MSFKFEQTAQCLSNFNSFKAKIFVSLYIRSNLFVPTNLNFSLFKSISIMDQYDFDSCAISINDNYRH